MLQCTSWPAPRPQERGRVGQTLGHPCPACEQMVLSAAGVTEHVRGSSMQSEVLIKGEGSALLVPTVKRSHH